MTLQAALLRVLPLVSPGRALAESEWCTLTRVAGVLLEGSPVPVAPEEVADNVEKFLVAGRSKRAWRVRALLTLIEFYPLAAVGTRFSKMSRERRRRLVTERYMTGTHLWAICAKIRFLVYLGAYGTARAHAPTGYVPITGRARFRDRHVNGAVA